MATPAREGGIGGAIRRRPFRKTASTPYERPPTAFRGANGGGRVAEGGGLISKIVDPASRLIARGASRLFSSVFRKALTAPPRTSEEDHRPREDASHVACNVLSPEIHKIDRNGDNQTNNSGSGGIADLERLLKQKTFTRVEFDRLAELLRSRTVETLKADHENTNEKMEEASVSAHKGVSSKAHESLSVRAGSLTVQKKIAQDEAASPAEIAKSYMVSRPLKDSPSVGSFSNQVFLGAANLSTPTIAKQLDLSVAPRSVIRFSGIPDHPQHGSQTARPPSRSAIYRMSRSPYFKVGEISRDHYSCQSSQWTPNTEKSGGRQALKRGSSTLDGDFESVGPIRRIRQKSNLMSPSKEAHTLLSGSQEAKNENFTINMLPPQSSETAQKLFHQLDKLFTSPKDKSSEQKTIARDESPSKLTLDMLHGSALRSTEDVDSSKFFITQGNGKLDTASDSHRPNVGNTCSQKLGVVEENGPLKSDGSGVKLAFDANGVISGPIPSKDAKPGMRSDTIAANSVALTVPKRPGFQMSAHEDAFELDDDDYNASDLSTPFSTAKGDADAKMSTNNNVIYETAISENPPNSSQSVPISNSVLFSKADKKDHIQPVVTEKNKGFAFAVASDSCTHSQPPPTPTMPNPMLDRPHLQKEQTSPTFSFGSNAAKSSTCVTDSAGVKVNEGSRSELTSVTSASTSSSEGSILVKSESHKNGGDIFKAFGNTISSSISASSAPAVFAFGASPAPSLCNGSLHSSSPVFSLPGTAAVESSIVNGCTATTSSSSTLSVYTAAPTFSTVPSFQFGSGISKDAPVSVSQSLDKSNNAIPLERSVNAAPFSLDSSTSQGAAAVLPSTVSGGCSDVASLVTFSSSGGSSFAAPSPSLMNSGASGSSASASLFSSTAGSSFSAMSPAFPSTGSSVFGFTASAQSTSSSPALDKVSSHDSAAATVPNSSTTFGATGGSANSSSLFAGNSFPSSTATAFGANGVSLFGNQSIQSATGASQLLQKSTSQFGSSSSSPSFGLGNSSAGSFGNSPFGSIASGANPFTSGSGFSFSTGTGSSGANGSSSFTPAATTSPFGSSSQASTSSIFASASSSNTSPSPGYSFGLQTSGSSSSPFTFGSSSASVFSFTSAGTTASATASAPAPVFGMSNPAIRFGSNTQGNDQMNEDNMTDDTNQAAAPSVPTFGQPANPPGFVFGSPAVQPVAPPVFQFGGSQNPTFSQNPSPFQQAGNVEFNAGGSFSLGSGGGDKSSRKYVKVKRDKTRRK